jgi:hypothetical protein
MIKFDCPECGEPMEIGDKMAGKEVRCRGCDEPVRVPRESRKDKPVRRRQEKREDKVP